MQAFFFDLRTAARHLRKTPAFSLAAILMLAFGIGATLAIFSIVNGILLRPLPFPHADQLVAISDILAGAPGAGGANGDFGSTAQDVVNLTRYSHSFSGLGGYAWTGFALAGHGIAPENIVGARLSSGVFPTLGAAPLLGRTFAAKEDTGHAPVALLSYSLWHSRYQSSPLVLGTRILLDRKPYTIIGVMPRSLEFPLGTGLDACKLWVPMSFTAQELSPEGDSSWNLQVVARLKPGITNAQALADLSNVDRETMREYPAYMASFHIRPDLHSLHADTVQDAKPLLHMLFLAVSVVLLIACANLAGLLLVRALRRRRETAVRLALGAHAATLLRQALLESLLLSSSGALLGTGLAAIAVHFGLTLLPDSLPLLHQISLSLPVLGFALVLALGTGGLCGIAPAIAALQTGMNEALKEGGRTGSTGGGSARLRSALVIGEVAVALALLTASALLLRSFVNMGAVRLGYQPDHVLTASYTLPKSAYSTQVQVSAFLSDALARTGQLPGVRNAALSSQLPANGSNSNQGFVAEGYTPPPGTTLNLGTPIYVQGRYFEALGIRLIGGRYLTADDTAKARLVPVVNRKLAEQSWPGQNPVGKRMRIGLTTTPTPWMTIVGEVEDIKEGAPDQPSKQQYYMPSDQQLAGYGALAPAGALSGDSGFLVLRTTLPPQQMENALRDAIHAIDPQLALDRVQTMDQSLAAIEAPRRFNTTLISAFAAAALLLAVLGIYSILAFSVALRTQEMAIRLALGSQRAGVMRLILLSGAKLAAVGCALGLVLAVAGEKLISSLLFGVSATDPVILALAALAIFLLTLAASLLPARRAASVSPVDALRAQ